MRTVVIFDSNYGNTKAVADKIAQELGNTARSISVGEMKANDLEGVEILIVGSPINGWRPTKKITDWIAQLGGLAAQKIKAAAFDTRMRSFLSGNAAKKIGKALQEKGMEMIIPPEPFYVNGSEGPLQQGELERAGAWARSISQKFNSTG